MDALVQTIAVYAIPVILAITLHEAAHAYAAKYFGDLTAYSQGRMSLNPIVHIDLLGTIIIPIVLYLATDGQFLFGYAKPVPVNFGALRKPKRDMAWVSLAGPASNFFMAFLWMILAVLLVAFKVEHEFFYRMAQAGLLTNLVMFAFNLFPIPPLDGGRILTSLLPHRQAYQFAKIEPYGFFIVMALVYFKILQFWMYPLMNIAQYILQLVLTPFTMLLK
ncbi:site-2 protease family protein [Undibacterium seohonense]|jgi:Zn-dependent protease|uniref:Site-2 protease family protein n=1 Tax=Undibacterium seohonense TaxID=1344950 RepID=A0ABR6WYU9_9BURK|nr:site-2 protease family protein [Undibacterium seohonense]MBC3805833.1 site-2 protease family protein [Undibacterium seohonense]